MAGTRITGAPNLSRLLSEASLELVLGFLTSPAVRDLFRPVVGDMPTVDDVRAHLRQVQRDDLDQIEKQALRVIRVAGPRADALARRLAEGTPFDCLADMEEWPGTINRAAWTYQSRNALFVATERAMQVRSFRDHTRVYEGYDAQTPRDLELADFNDMEFAESLAARLQLRHGCRVESVELPENGASKRQIMIAVAAAGPRESQRTFETDLTEGLVQYRPLNELILVYVPETGRIDLCGRGWKDRKIIAETFAGEILGEDLSVRPPVRRTYDMAPFRGPLEFEVPASLQDRVLSVCVTELRVALGSYERKITLTVLPGENMEALRQSVFGHARSRLGRGFVCDVEFYLKVAIPDAQERPLRFRIDNHNSSTLQAEPDPDLREIGFEFLEAIGVVKATRLPDAGETDDLLPNLLALLEHPDREIVGTELEQMRADTDRLVRLRFLRARQFIETILIEEDDIGEVEAEVSPDPGRRSADIHAVSGSIDRTRPLAEVTKWTIHRDYILETVAKDLSPHFGGSRPVRLDSDLLQLGTIEFRQRKYPVFLATRLSDDVMFARVENEIRSAGRSVGGIVLATGPAMSRFLGGHAIIELAPLLEMGEVTLDSLLGAWHGLRSRAEAAADVTFERFSDTRAELVIPGREPWPITGRKPVLIVERLYRAYLDGETMVKSGDLKACADVVQIGPAFGADWPRVRDTYICQPKNTYYALATGRS